MLLAHDRWGQLEALLGRFTLSLIKVPDGQAIPGSHWGSPEAGLKAACVHARADTPVHSVLHESCHAICMSAARRAHLDTNAGGDDTEENAVCYLQIILAQPLYGNAIGAVCADMDAWGYSFRLGSARAWFERDAEDARAFLMQHDLLDSAGQATFRMRA